MSKNPKAVIEPHQQAHEDHLALLGDCKSAEFDFRLIWPKEKKLPEGWKKAFNIRGSRTDKSVRQELQEANQKGYGVFVTVNETDGKGRKAHNVTRVRAVYADWDEGRPEDLPLPPSFVICTSRGKFQAYWLVRDHMTIEQFASVMERIVHDFGGDPGAKDVARVLRLAGYDHTKSDPYPVRFVGIDANVEDYSAAELN